MTKTINQQNPKNAVMLRDLPYTARTRKKKRMLLEFKARMMKIAVNNSSSWQLLAGATAGDVSHNKDKTAFS